ncbi:MAG: HprK-related kinase A [Rhodocyclaceae bacterium]|nr:HprK-related kinase A [Rhodocyclaceae bacterium]
MKQAAVVVGELGLQQLHDSLEQGVFAVRTGALLFRMQCVFEDVTRSIHVLYSEHPFQIAPEFSDFHVEVRAPLNLRRWFRPQAEFFIDGEPPFEPLPRDQAPALLEWGMNWTIAASCHQWFTLHAASLEYNGHAVILPAPPGSGKSTLCAALAFRGWRLLSDELTLLDPDTLRTNALARPINLKNASIDLMRKFEPDAIWSPESYDTQKGRVAHLRPPADSVRRMTDKAAPRWIVFPKYVPDAEPLLTPRSKTQTFMQLAENAFNYATLGETGFDAIARLLDQCECYDFVYSQLDDALEVFEWLASAGDAEEQGRRIPANMQ